MKRPSSPTRAAIALALLTTAALCFAAPGAADTSGRLGAAKERLAQLQGDLDRATARYQDAYDRAVRTSQQLDVTRRAIASTQTRIRRVRGMLSRRARTAYEAGVGTTLDVLLSAGSIGEFSDRLEFLGAVERSQSDLVVAARVGGTLLRRQQHDLTRLEAQQREVAASLEQEQSAIESRLAEARSLVSELTQQLRAEQRTHAALALYGIHTVSGGVLATCPVAGPHSYIDSFGAPRVGHTHQGDDIMAPRGTPVVAAQTGNAVQDPNDLGGNAVIVYADNGDYTYYAHLDSYGASGHVSAGTQIGTVGNTGDAAGGPTHLHFEYHPGGGSAVDPTPYLDAVC